MAVKISASTEVRAMLPIRIRPSRKCTGSPSSYLPGVPSRVLSRRLRPGHAMVVCAAEMVGAGSIRLVFVITRIASSPSSTPSLSITFSITSIACGSALCAWTLPSRSGGLDRFPGHHVAGDLGVEARGHRVGRGSQVEWILIARRALREDRDDPLRAAPALRHVSGRGGTQRCTVLSLSQFSDGADILIC